MHQALEIIILEIPGFLVVTIRLQETPLEAHTVQQGGIMAQWEARMAQHGDLMAQLEDIMVRLVVITVQ